MTRKSQSNPYEFFITRELNLIFDSSGFLALANIRVTEVITIFTRSAASKLPSSFTNRVKTVTASMSNV